MSEREDHPPLEVPHPHLKEFMAFLPEFNKETPRGGILISCVMIDNLLARAIRSFLVNHNDVESLLEGFSAPLGTFSARILAAFSLGVITEREYRECQILRKIRNAFAHDVHISFRDQRISDLCKNLTMCAQDYEGVQLDERERFMTSAAALILNLTNRPHYAEQRRLTVQTWPY